MFGHAFIKQKRVCARCDSCTYNQCETRSCHVGAFLLRARFLARPTPLLAHVHRACLRPPPSKTAAALLVNSCCEAVQANQGMQSGLCEAYGPCCLDSLHHLSQYGVRRHRWTRSSAVALSLLWSQPRTNIPFPERASRLRWQEKGDVKLKRKLTPVCIRQVRVSL